MKIRGSLFALVFFAVLLEELPAARAQQHPNLERGFSPERLYNFGGIDSVGMLNLNLNLSIPIGQSYPVSTNFSYSIHLVYNSKLWDYEPFTTGEPDGTVMEAVANRRSNAGFGWEISLGSLTGPGAAPDSGNPWKFQSPDGGEHRFYPTLHPGETAVPDVYYTRDSSYLRMRMTQRGASAEIDSPDGVTREFAYQSNNRWRLTRIRNQFKDQTGEYTNFVTITYSGSTTRCTGETSVWTLRDAHGRESDVCFTDYRLNDVSAPMVTEVVQPAFPAANGTLQVARHKFTYATRTVTRGCNVKTTTLSETLQLPMLEAIELPDGSSYSMSYYLGAQPADASCMQGSIASLGLPTSGSIAWDYGKIEMPVYRDCQRPLQWAELSSAVGRKTLRDGNGGLVGEWTYESQLSDLPSMPGYACEDGSYAWSDPPREQMKNSVTLPTGDKVVHYFSVWPGSGGENGAATSVNGFQQSEYTLPFTRSSELTHGGHLLSQETFACPSGACAASPMRRHYVLYERDAGLFAGGTGMGHENWRRRSSRTVYLDDPRPGQPTANDMNADDDFFSETIVLTGFDGYGNYRTTSRTSDFHANDEEVSFTDYNPGADANGRNPAAPGQLSIGSTAPWITALYTDQLRKVKLSSGWESSASTHCFDSSNGALLGSRVLKNKGTGARPEASRNDIVRIFTRTFESDGLTISRGDLQTEDVFGGDLVQLSETVDLCSPPAIPSANQTVNHYVAGSLATSQRAGVGWKHIDFTIDPSTGLVKVSRDPAGVATTLRFDPSGRISAMQPATGNGAWTEYQYTNASGATPASVSVLESTNGSSSGDLRQTKFEFDAFGRLVKEQRSVPTVAVPAGETVSRITRYNALGWRTGVSEWASGTPTQFTTSSEFDPFGRPGRITPPSSVSGSHDVTFSRRGVREVRRTVGIGGGEAALIPATVVDKYDAAGRLVEVVESLNCSVAQVPCPSGAPEGQVCYTKENPCELPGPVTQYSYDVLGNLSRVCAKETAVTSGCTQTRLFDYDGRGFLVRETTPERGASGNGTTIYSLFDSRGNPGQRLTGAENGLFDLRTSYDAIGRPLTLSSHGGARVVKEWVYDARSGYTRPGAMVRSIRRNSDSIFGNDFVVTEDIKYEGGAGRISTIDTTIAHATAGTKSFAQTWTWTDLGSADETTYPSFEGLSAFVTKNEYVAGSLTKVRNTNVPAGEYASSIRYHANGLTHQVAHTNGMTETVLGDASGMARPRSISVSGASSWSSGDYAYDGAGNIKSIGDTRYSYDGASRLTSWTRTSGTGSSTSLLGYDAFGNKYDAGISGCGSPAAGVMHCWQSSVLKPEINAATNHFAEMTYDADGNVVRHGTYDYLYDGTSMMTGMSTGSREFRYIYTADNERIGTYDVATQSWNWKLRDIGGKPLREFTSSGGTLGFANWNWANDYIYRGNTILASVTPSETQHFHTDHLGTPRLITGAGGAQRGRHDYEPFGAETTSSLQNNQLLKFTAHERDLNGPAGSEDRSYLDYMHARYYNPNLGRFSSIDPAGYDLHRPQTFNRYSYVANNPMNFLDPTGRCGERATFIGPRLPCEVTLKPPSNHQNWTDEQRAAENIKNAQRAQLAEEGKLVVSRGQPRPSSTQVAAANGGAAPAGMHLDHTQEIVLGGEPLASENIKPLDRVVNTSNGSRVKNAIAGLANGTVITKFNYTILSGGSVLTSLAQGLSYHEFLANQEIAHPGFLNPNDMLRWLTTGDTRATPTPCTYNNPC